ncbi:MAG TPA: tetratricopeptide repeat protein [Clostridiaceae bacterium]|nr:tetratricopeptide repeat protein [Clostridiaceae bacterium]
MINLRDELVNFAPIDLENIVKINPEISEEYKTSVNLYNSALENLKYNSEDIAIIELKKAVALNPDFCEAVTLLGLCFLYMKAYEKAEEMFKRVIKAESNGARAFDYLNRMKNDVTEQQDDKDKLQKGKRKKTTKSQKSNSKNSASKFSEKNPKEMSSSISRNASYGIPEVPLRGRMKANNKDSLIRFVTGIIIGLIIAFIIGVPGILGLNNKDDDSKDDASAEIIAALNEKIQDYENKNSMLNQEIDKLKKDLENAQKNAEYSKALIKLFEAEELLKNNMYEEAADILVSVRDVEFIDEDKGKYDELVNRTMQVAADRAYVQGYNLFQSGNYQQALEKFKKVPEYMENYSKMDIVLYYIGKTYLELKDNENAKLAFQEVIEKFPNSEYARYSEHRLNGLTAN